MANGRDVVLSHTTETLFSDIAASSALLLVSLAGPLCSRSCPSLPSKRCVSKLFVARIPWGPIGACREDVGAFHDTGVDEDDLAGLDIAKSDVLVDNRLSKTCLTTLLWQRELPSVWLHVLRDLAQDTCHVTQLHWCVRVEGFPIRVCPLRSDQRLLALSSRHGP